MAEEGYRVTLNVYDLSQGLARQLSTSFLGKAIEGIWHTGIVVYGNEYFFGGGIQHLPAGSTPYGTPLKVVELGVTHVPKDVFEMYLQEINPRYLPETYSLLTHNCNNFSNEVAQFLVGATIPDYILQLPNEVMSSPMGSLFLPMIQNLETTLKSGGVPQVPQFRPTTVSPASNFASVTTQKSSTAPNSSTEKKAIPSKEVAKGKEEDKKTENAVSASEKAAAASNGVVKDPLGDARSKVQDEIIKEFAAIMATGTMRASEAAALATRRVMERHGQMSVSQS
ncbi:putative PPPDE putative peptidase domain-containing protein [Medicago truncatula]|uniref:PPPDE thiol peptidase family protein, putative n=1 Tax=Medicago truncatula TaxID=3880 RepID=G7L195_MEDTR|nr:desumoylating isopeptidase 1 [Medicago truncatula]XP_024627136.1 desumoylating isopeptidase 1 [Medicago truncatula]AES79151.1 PPPDE thiol peptidase family protein, putative [Medicago truncatula]RHN45982.1 putative PPPDE putative peptidase domain-containing protein [Medicago truncatula]